MCSVGLNTADEKPFSVQFIAEGHQQFFLTNKSNVPYTSLVETRPLSAVLCPDNQAAHLEAPGVVFPKAPWAPASIISFSNLYRHGTYRGSIGMAPDYWSLLVVGFVTGGVWDLIHLDLHIHLCWLFITTPYILPLHSVLLFHTSPVSPQALTWAELSCEDSSRCYLCVILSTVS